MWSLRNVDADFTLLESGTGTSNLAAGDEIRRWSRMRVHHHVFPHYLDQPLLFPSRASRAAPPDWPSPGRVDGSAHIIEDRGLVFLFNSGDAPRPGEFALTEESIGLRGRGAYQITQEYPEPAQTRSAQYGDAVQWDVPLQSALVLRVEPAR